MAAPLPDNLVPVHPFSHLLEHLANSYARTEKGWLTVANFRIDNDVAAKSFPAHVDFPCVDL